MSRLTEEQIQLLQDNGKQISSLMDANERILEQAGYNTPVDNIRFAKKMSYKVPKHYVRSKDYFMTEYKLYRICSGHGENAYNIASNIAYHLILSDFYNFQLNRMGFYGPVLALMYKQATINVVSIIEGLFKAYIETAHKPCICCPQAETCENRITKRQIKQRFQDLIQVYESCKILDLSEELRQTLLDLYVYRNRIHVMKSTENELTSEEHTQEKYNQAIDTLKMTAALMKNAVALSEQNTECQRYVCADNNEKSSV